MSTTIDPWGPPPSSSDPNREPPLPRSSKGPWRLLTNFAEGSQIHKAFSVWPDDVMTPQLLKDIYEGKAESPIGPIPFLDDAEGMRLWEFFGRHRKALFNPLGDYLRESKVGLSPLWGGVLPILQSHLVFALRRAEVQTGMWGGRSPRQKQGTVFAVTQDTGWLCRVSALPGSPGARVCVPWGGPYAEYCKIMPLLENRYTRLVFDSASPEMEVVPEGHVIRKMQFAGLVRERNRGFMGSVWTLTMPSVGLEELGGEVLPAVEQVAQGISIHLAELLPEITSVMRLGQYPSLEGHGDYVEMACGVLFGLLCEWAMEESLVRRPPSFLVKEDAVFVERTFTQKIRDKYPDLPGIAILRDARAIWSAITSKQ